MSPNKRPGAADAGMEPVSHRERMRQGLWYDANYDPELLAQRTRADVLCWKFNQSDPRDTAAREAILRELFPHMEEQVSILPMLYVDYGENCFIGKGTFINHNTYLMDGAPIHIGRNCFIGPGCGFYTAQHPLWAEDRIQGLEKALPIIVEDRVWIGASVIVLPGVTIGEGSVVGAGSVVKQDIPANMVCSGNPCQAVRRITEKDRLRLE